MLTGFINYIWVVIHFFRSAKQHGHGIVLPNVVRKSVVSLKLGFISIYSEQWCPCFQLVTWRHGPTIGTNTWLLTSHLGRYFCYTYTCNKHVVYMCILSVYAYVWEREREFFKLTLVLLQSNQYFNDDLVNNSLY